MNLNNSMYAIGEYKIFKNNNLVASQKNALTSFGKTAAMQTLIGQTLRFAGSIGIGTSSSANTINTSSSLITNNRLGFELSKYDINGTYFDISEKYSKLVFRTSIQDNIRYKIRELGLFSPYLENKSVRSSMLVNFEPDEVFIDQNNFGITSTVSTSVPYFVTSTSKPAITYGTNAIVVPGANAAAIKKQTVVIPRVSDSDNITISYIKESSFSSTIRLYLYTDSYFQYYDFTNASSGSIIQSSNISSFSGSGGTGSINWNSITSIRFENRSANANQIVILDGLRFDSDQGPLDIGNALLSRVVLTNEIISEPSDEIELEYHLSLGFNEAI